jgi:hypothetical protein
MRSLSGMHIDHAIENFCQSLYGGASVAEQHRQIEHWAEVGETELLLRLAVALEGRKWDNAVKAWAIEAVFNRIEDALALTPALRQAEALLTLSLLNGCTLMHRRAGSTRWPGTSVWGLSDRASSRSPYWRRPTQIKRLEWHTGGIDLEIEIEQPGQYRVLFEEPNGNAGLEAELAVADLLRLSELTARLSPQA